jgi:hypothetical protein
MAKHSCESYNGQRHKEKREFYKRYRHPDIQSFYKAKLFALFENRCFKCKSLGPLDIDHHIPLALGGHFVAGNLVVLCKICNGLKLDLPPELFYSKDELDRLQPLLNTENKLLDFTWDWEGYNRDREGYFRSIGLAEDVLLRIFSDLDYEYYVEQKPTTIFK